MAEVILATLFFVVGIGSLVWFLWLWPARLNRGLSKSDPGARPFFFGYFLASYHLWGVFSAVIMILTIPFYPEGQAVPAQIFGILVLYGAAYGLIGYGLLKRRKIAWVVLLGFYWLWPVFIAFWTEIGFGMIIFIFSAAYLIPTTIYVKRRWYEFD